MSDVVEVEGLTRAFGHHRGVIDVSFTIAPGEVFGFLGPNGAGKSTTIRLLLGLHTPDAGRIRVFGHDPRSEHVAVASHVGYLPGELALFARLTGRQHVAAAARARQRVLGGNQPDTHLCDELVRRFRVELDRPVRTLSKGNRQKIGIVLAFMHRPALLVLDEPTAGLDPLLQDEFARLLRETVDEGRSVLLSSHELDEVQRVTDRLAIIRHGRIVVTDSVEGLRAQAPRTVAFRFPSRVDRSRFERLDGVRLQPGTRDQEDAGDTVTLTLTGPVAPLLRVAADLGAVDVTARPSDLEELFLTYYRDSSEEGA